MSLSHFFWNVSPSLYVYIYIYIYICIVINRQSISLYDNSIVWLDTRNCFKLRSKPSSLYVCRISYPNRAIAILCVSEGICFYMYFFTYTLSAIGSAQFSRKNYCVSAYETVGKFSTRVLKPRGGKHTHTHTHTHTLYIYIYIYIPW